MRNTIKTTTYKGHDLNDEFKTYARKCRKEIDNAFKANGGYIFKFNIGFYYYSGFGYINGQHYYFSISDVRHFKDAKILFRTCKDEFDYTGGTNQYLSTSDAS